MPISHNDSTRIATLDFASKEVIGDMASDLLLHACCRWTVDGAKKGLIGYLCAGFFALGIPIAFVQLLPGSTYLKIDEDGLTFANMFRVIKVSWSDISEFFVVSIKQTGVTVRKMVAFNYAPSYDRNRIGRQLNSAIAGCEGALPDTYGKKTMAFNLLNRYRHLLGILLDCCNLQYQFGSFLGNCSITRWD